MAEKRQNKEWSPDTHRHTRPLVSLYLVGSKFFFRADKNIFFKRLIQSNAQTTSYGKLSLIVCSEKNCLGFFKFWLEKTHQKPTRAGYPICRDFLRARTLRCPYQDWQTTGLAKRMLWRDIFLFLFLSFQLAPGCTSAFIRGADSGQVCTSNFCSWW